MYVYINIIYIYIKISIILSGENDHISPKNGKFEKSSFLKSAVWPRQIDDLHWTHEG